jgi:hypothetical protein
MELVATGPDNYREEQVIADAWSRIGTKKRGRDRDPAPAASSGLHIV